MKLTFNSITYTTLERVDERITTIYHGLQIYEYECNSFFNDVHGKATTHYKISKY